MMKIGRLPCLLMLALVSGACTNNVAGGDDETGVTETGGTETGEPPYVDQVPCGPEECVTDVDCCRTHTLGLQYTDMSCGAAARYPNRWSCSAGECVNSGCDPLGSDCIVPFACHEVDSVGYCIQTCSNDQDCVEIVGNEAGQTVCIGLTDDNPPVKFCEEPPA